MLWFLIFNPQADKRKGYLHEFIALLHFLTVLGKLDTADFIHATKWLHKNKSFDAENLADGAPLALVNEINRVLQSAVKSGLSTGIKHEVPEALTQALDRNVFVFSGLKVYHELKEASLLLKDENGGIKPYNTFKQEMTALHQAYNVNHLEAEYNFATGTAQMAAKWNDFEQDGDAYDLQYRTAADEKVRASHFILHNTTLPPSDPFWNENAPPLDWGHRGAGFKRQVPAKQQRRGSSQRPQGNHPAGQRWGKPCGHVPFQSR